MGNQEVFECRQRSFHLPGEGAPISFSDSCVGAIPVPGEPAIDLSGQVKPGRISVLQELDGAFLSYSRSYASFLNPSIREFIASIIVNVRDIGEDLLTSSIRFKQVVSLWELSQAYPESALASIFHQDLDLLFDATVRLIEKPSTRWEKMRDGSQRGSTIDMGTEGRIGFLIEIASKHQEIRFAELASRSAEQLAASWYYHFPNFWAATGLCVEIGENAWFLSNGGPSVFRVLLNGLKNDLNRAVANDWLAMLEFPSNALEWTEDDENHLIESLQLYCESGVGEEINDCTTLDQKTGLKDDLEKLVEKYGIPLEKSIRKLEEEIAEREEEEQEDFDDERNCDIGHPIEYKEFASDDDVSQMFSTLLDV